MMLLLLMMRMMRRMRRRERQVSAEPQRVIEVLVLRAVANRERVRGEEGAQRREVVDKRQRRRRVSLLEQRPVIAEIPQVDEARVGREEEQAHAEPVRESLWEIQRELDEVDPARGGARELEEGEEAQSMLVEDVGEGGELEDEQCVLELALVQVSAHAPRLLLLIHDRVDREAHDGRGRRGRGRGRGERQVDLLGDLQALQLAFGAPSRFAEALVLHAHDDDEAHQPHPRHHRHKARIILGRQRSSTARRALGRWRWAGLCGSPRCFLKLWSFLWWTCDWT
mmetsp:Transcript_28593/g.68197  ORF Transcript_28593/g.68197 Transcript_28593/m.68197 type:complete len:282 (-) Transcript_28593:378-1223(-)